MTDDEWVRPPDPTDILPEPLRIEALRRRQIVRVGGVVVTALVGLILLMVATADFFVRVWSYRQWFGP